MIYPIAKRTLDLVVSIVLLILLSPLLVAIALMVISTSRGPSLYRGKRAGCGNRTFEILKFRTMVVDAENLGGPSTALEDPRITSIGRFLRANKLDELPQLVNVIKGEMSLVPLCPLEPLTPLGSTPYREGILRGQEEARKRS